MRRPPEREVELGQRVDLGRNSRRVARPRRGLRGDLPAARAAYEGGGEAPETSDVFRWLQLSGAELALAEGQAEDALELVDRATRRTARFSNPGWSPHRGIKARILDRLGREEEAIAVAEEEVEVARRWGAPGVLGRSLRILGTIEREAGIGHLAEAVALLERTPYRLELAKALAAVGAALRRARRPADAREPLRRALELAEVCNAPPVAEHARSELYSSGSRPRTAALRGVKALTASERRVASLAAVGHTNRDIAQELFVTPKTVELHLSNAYRKLDIRSRRDLAAAMEGAEA